MEAAQFHMDKKLIWSLSLSWPCSECMTSSVKHSLRRPATGPGFAIFYCGSYLLNACSKKFGYSLNGIIFVYFLHSTSELGLVKLSTRQTKNVLVVVLGYVEQHWKALEESFHLRLWTKKF